MTVQPNQHKRISVAGLGGDYLKLLLTIKIAQKRGNALEHIISRKNFDNEDGFNKERLEAIDTLNRWVDELPTEPHMVRELKTTK